MESLGGDAVPGGVGCWMRGVGAVGVKGGGEGCAEGEEETSCFLKVNMSRGRRLGSGRVERIEAR